MPKMERSSSARSCCFFLLLPVARQAEDAGEHAVGHLVVKADAHIVLHAHVAKEADVLEGAGHAQFVGLHGVHAGGVLAVDHDGAGGGLVDLGQQVEHRGLARAVGADEAGDLGLADGEVEVLHGLEAAELDAQMPRFQHGQLVHIALGHDAVAGEGHHFGGRSALRHAASPPFPSSPRLCGSMRAKRARVIGLLLTSMTRISTTA